MRSVRTVNCLGMDVFSDDSDGGWFSDSSDDSDGGVNRQCWAACAREEARELRKKWTLIAGRCKGHIDYEVSVIC